MIITIDGSAGTGKTTVARLLAQKLHITFFETGALYRSLALFLKNRGIDLKEEERITHELPQFKVDIRLDEQHNKRYFLEDKEVTQAIKTPEITEASSIVSAYPSVRQYLLKFQRDFAKLHDAVFEGRDLGSVVFPDADFKVFLFASEKVRAERRLKEWQEKHPHEEISFDKVLTAILERDTRDSERKIAPLKCPEGALSIDTSNLKPEEVVEKIYAELKL